MYCFSHNITIRVTQAQVKIQECSQWNALTVQDGIPTWKGMSLKDRHIYSKKAASKLDLGAVYTGWGEEVSIRLCIPGLMYLRHSMTYTYAASTGPFSSPQT